VTATCIGTISVDILYAGSDISRRRSRPRNELQGACLRSELQVYKSCIASESSDCPATGPAVRSTTPSGQTALAPYRQTRRSAKIQCSRGCPLYLKLAVRVASDRPSQPLSPIAQREGTQLVLASHSQWSWSVGEGRGDSVGCF